MDLLVMASIYSVLFCLLSASELVTEDGLSATFIDYIDGTRYFIRQNTAYEQ